MNTNTNLIAEQMPELALRQPNKSLQTVCDISASFKYSFKNIDLSLGKNNLSEGVLLAEDRDYFKSSEETSQSNSAAASPIRQNSFLSKISLK